MRILAGADFHGNLGIVGWFVGQAGALGPEAVVLAGDLLGFAEEVEDDLEAQKLSAEQMVAKLLEVEVPIFFIMGNDDLIELEPAEVVGFGLSPIESCTYVYDQALTIGALRLRACLVRASRISR